MTQAPLFGRSTETTWLDAALGRVAGGAGGAAFLIGPPGLGKTRLVEYAAENARAIDVQVAIGRCWEAGGAPTGWPFVEALRCWRGHPALPAACEALGPQRAHLRHLHPELAPSSKPAAHVELDASMRFLAFDAVAALWSELARAKPCLLVLEDLHAADLYTAELLDMLCRRASEAPLFVLGSYRSREARLSQQVGDVLARASRAAHLLELSPLVAEEAERMTRDALGAEVSAEQVRRIVQASDGNPLFLKELARGAGRAGPGRALSGLDHVIAAHVSTLGPLARDVADLASVFGRHLDAGVFRRTCRDALQLDDRAIASALMELAEREILVSSDDGGLAFLHILVRDALHDRLAPGRREAFHAAALAHLEHVGAPSSQLAHHALAAGRALHGERTIALTRRAAKQASATLAFLDAATMLARLVELAEELDWLEPAALLSLRLDLAEAEIFAGRLSVGRGICERVAAAAETLDDAELLARAALVYGSEFMRGSVNRTMVGLLERALEKLGDAVTPSRARVLARYAAALFPAHDPEIPVRTAQQAIALARELGDARTLAEALYFARLPLFFWFPIRELLPLEKEALALARQVGTPAELTRALGLAALAHMLAGELDTYDALIAEALALAEGAQSPQQVFRLHLLHAMGATRRGDFVGAKAITAQARACTERGPVEAAVPVFTLSQFGSARLRRDREELRQMGDEIVRLLATMPNAAAIIASFHTFTGDLAAARAEMAKCPADLRGRPVAAQCCLAEAALTVGDLELLRELYDLILPFRDDIVSLGMMGFTSEGVAHGWLGRIAAALDRPADAERHFERAAELDEASGGWPSLANVLEDWAEHLASTSDPPKRRRAAELLDRAAALLTELGLEVRAEAARSRRSGLDETEPTTPSAVHTKAVMLELRREGDMVAVTFGAERFSVRDSKGMRYLELLVQSAGSEIHALELLSAEAGPGARAAFGGDAGPMLDAEAKSTYRERLRSLQEDLAEAEDFGDLARAEARRSEMEALVAELARATGLGGRDRRGASSAERARVNVQRRLKAAVSALARHSRAVDEHLSRALRTGTFCRYDPPAMP